MEASDPLAEPTDDDPFAGVAPDAGDIPPVPAGEPDPELVSQGTLEGENPSEETDPLAEPTADDVLADPEASEDDPEPLPDPEPVPETPAEEPPPPPEPEPTPEPTPEPDPPAEEKAEAKKPAAKKKTAKQPDAKKGEREYVVVHLDKDDKPIGVVGELNARDERTARVKTFEGMSGVEEAALVAVPARYWKPKTMRKKTREVHDIEED